MTAAEAAAAAPARRGRARPDDPARAGRGDQPDPGGTRQHGRGPGGQGGREGPGPAAGDRGLRAAQGQGTGVNQGLSGKADQVKGEVTGRAAGARQAVTENGKTVLARGNRHQAAPAARPGGQRSRAASAPVRHRPGGHTGQHRAEPVQQRAGGPRPPEPATGYRSRRRDRPRAACCWRGWLVVRAPPALTWRPISSAPGLIADQARLVCLPRAGLSWRARSPADRSACRPARGRPSWPTGGSGAGSPLPGPRWPPPAAGRPAASSRSYSRP